MGAAKVTDIDPDLLHDLKDELEEKHAICADLLLKLESSPDDLELVRTLFREVHTVKGDVGLIGIHQYLPLLQSIEDVIDELRKKQLPYTAAVSDVLLLTLDLTHKELMAFIAKKDGFNDKHYNNVASMVAKMARLKGDEQQQQTLAVIQTLAPETKPTFEADAEQTEHYFTQEEINEEVAFFLQLSLLFDHRSPYGAGRTERMFELAMTMNLNAGNPLPTDQLQTAVYLHDLGMAFVPKSMVKKASNLSRHDWAWVKNHVNVVCELIRPFDIWGMATEIIKQHHERLDGSGYPQGLKDKDICTGAKLLAIVDSFEAITQTRAYQNDQQRPIVRAITEINQQAGILYCPFWVGHFNEAVRSLHTKKQKKAGK